MKKIKFEPTNKIIEQISDKPRPMKSKVPDWFINTKQYSNGKNDFFKAEQQHLVDGKDFSGTFKACMPFTDTMTSGYTIVLPATVLVTNNKNAEDVPRLDWKVGVSLLDLQKSNVAEKYPVPLGYNKNVFRWSPEWKITTPNGYSSLVMHPAHRYDLPFITLTGLVDTDVHPNSLLFPFFIKQGFEGWIEEGTPIAQIIPIKRDNWESEVGPFIEDSFFIGQKIKKTFVQAYKKLYWSRKSYL
jgi:hypothetical protein